MSTTLVSYALWLLLGVSGAHHFYLGRHRQGFLWLTTLAFLGLGWLRDAFCLPRYVREARANPSGASDSGRTRPTALRRRLAMRKVSWARLAAMVVVGHLYGYLLLCYLLNTGHFRYDLFRRELELQACLLTVPAVGIAVGVHLVGSIGQLQASFLWSLLGSALGLAVPWVDNTRSIGYLATSSLLATTLTYLKGLTLKSAKKSPGGLPHRARSFVLKLVLLVACCFVYGFLLIAAVDHHSVPYSKVEEEDGLLVKKVLVGCGPLIKDILKQFMYLAEQFFTTTYYVVVDFCVRLETFVEIFKNAIAEQFITTTSFVKELITTVYNTAADIYFTLEHYIVLFGHFISPLYDAVADFYPRLQQFLSWSWDLLTEICAEFGKYFEWLTMAIWTQEQSDTDEQTSRYEEEYVEPFDLSERDPYKILGVSSASSTLRDIKIAYNKMVKKWHPDKIQGRSRKERAHAIFIKIQWAYEQLKQRHKKW